MKVGDTIVMESEIEKKENKGIVMTEYQIIGIYKACVLGKTKTGIRRCFGIGDLVEKGYVKQTGRYEELRVERETFVGDTGRKKRGKKMEEKKCL